MALVDHQQRVLGEVLEQGWRRLAGLSAREIARIVLDAGAGARRFHHLDVEDRALFQPLGLEQPPGAVELVEPLLQVGLDLLDRLLHRRPGRHVMAVGVDDDVRQRRRLLAGQRIELDNRVDLVAEQFDAPGLVLVVGREEVDGVAAHAEGAALEGVVVPLVLLLDEAAQQGGTVDLLAFGEAEGHRLVVLQRADTVDARNRRHDDDVVALHQRPRRGMAHAVDLLVDRRILLDVGVGARHIGFGLVVVVVGDEVLDRILREEAPHLAPQLRGQRLVGCQHEGGLAGRGDHVGHGEGLARSGNAQQDLVAFAVGHALEQLADRLGLIARRRVIRHQLEGFAADRFRPPLDVRHQERNSRNREIL